MASPPEVMSAGEPNLSTSILSYFPLLNTVVSMLSSLMSKKQSPCQGVGCELAREREAPSVRARCRPGRGQHGAAEAGGLS